MLTTYSAILTLLVTSAICSDLSATVGGGIGSYSNYGKATREGNIHPNGTRSVPFTLGSQDWILRVNVSALAVPDSSSGPGSRYINTVYDLQWPGSESINKTVAAAFGRETDPHFCASVILSNFPANVTNAWGEGNSSCAGALGTACLNALTMQYSAAASTHANSGNGCPSGVFPQNIPECNGTFAGDVSTLGLSLLDPGLNSTKYTSEPDNSAWPLKNGHGFAFRSFAPHANNSISYAEEDTRLHMVILSSKTAIFPICARVNASDLTPTSPGAAQPSPSHGAASDLSVFNPSTGAGLFAAMVLVSYVL